MVLANEDLLAISKVLESGLQPVVLGVEKLGDRVTVLENKVTELKSDVAEVKTEVTELKGEVTEVRAEVTELKGEVTEVRAEVTELKSEVAEVKTEVSELRRKVTVTNLEIENNIRPQIQLLAENYVPAAKRYERASSYMEEMQADIDIMKKVITEHSETLQKLA